MRDLSRATTAEDFFLALEMPFEQRVLDVYRLHILHRFRRYLAESGNARQASEEVMRSCLARAYADFAGPAPAAKTLKVFQAARTFVPLADVAGG
ncbi:MAG: nitrogenase [Magnetospirillum sp.]|nr:nitrogenase [Magnetospirillum sp.]